MRDSQRELGTIKSVRVCYEGDRDFWTCYVDLEFGGSGQAFGCLILTKDQAESFEKDVQKIFNVTDTKDLIGKQCYALRCLGYWNDVIEGIESVDTGKIMTITGFCNRKGFPTKNRFEREIEKITDAVARAKQVINEADAKIINIRKNFIDWKEK